MRRTATMSDRLAVVETDFGRDGGWYVERDGRRLALLTAPFRADPAWVSCRLEPLTNDPGDLTELYDEAFWAAPDRLVFRGRESGQAVAGVAVSRNPGWLLRHEGRLLVRGLCPHAPRSPWDGLRVWRRGGPRPGGPHAAGLRAGDDPVGRAV